MFALHFLIFLETLTTERGGAHCTHNFNNTHIHVQGRLGESHECPPRPIPKNDLFPCKSTSKTHIDVKAHNKPPRRVTVDRTLECQLWAKNSPQGAQAENALNGLPVVGIKRRAPSADIDGGRLASGLGRVDGHTAIGRSPAGNRIRAKGGIVGLDGCSGTSKVGGVVKVQAGRPKAHGQGRSSVRVDRSRPRNHKARERDGGCWKWSYISFRYVFTG